MSSLSFYVMFVIISATGETTTHASFPRFAEYEVCQTAHDWVLLNEQYRGYLKLTDGDTVKSFCIHEPSETES